MIWQVGQVGTLMRLNLAFINIIQDKFDDWLKNSILVEQKWVGTNI